MDEMKTVVTLLVALVPMITALIMWWLDRGRKAGRVQIYYDRAVKLQEVIKDRSDSNASLIDARDHCLKKAQEIENQPKKQMELDTAGILFMALGVFAVIIAVGLEGGAGALKWFSNVVVWIMAAAFGGIGLIVLIWSAIKGSGE